jgi:hypothetical protein
MGRRDALNPAVEMVKVTRVVELAVDDGADFMFQLISSETCWSRKQLLDSANGQFCGQGGFNLVWLVSIG